LVGFKLLVRHRPAEKKPAREITTDANLMEKLMIQSQGGLAREPAEHASLAGKKDAFTRVTAFFYGIVAYALFIGTFLYTIGFVAGLGVPKTLDTGKVAPLAEAVRIDLSLLAVFAIQHSVMARPWFKQWWTQFIPKPIERSTYVLFASSALALLVWQWRPIPAVVWQVQDAGIAATVTGVSLSGWLFALISTFLINHFELFGLHQVTSHLAGRPTPAPRFLTPVFYNFVRHPLYLGLLIAFWASPTMTAGHLLFAAWMTAYILLGIVFEERDLSDLFGDEYRRYKDRVSMLVPLRK
jgi:protein-S-isoprenylcysteine O-methyltransferase Ste14